VTTDESLRSAERWLRRRRGGIRAWLAGAALLDWAAVVVLVAQAGLLARILDQVLFHGAAVADQQKALALLLLLLPLRSALLWGADQCSAEGAVRLQQRLREELLKKLRRLGPAWLSGQASGDLVATLGEGIEALAGYYSSYLPAMSRVMAVPPTLLVFVFFRDWLSGLVLLATAPLVPFFMILIGKGAQRRNQRQWRALARMSSHLLDRLRGLSTLKQLDASRREAEVVARISEDYRLRTLSVLRIAFLSSFTLEFFATVSIAVVAVLVGFRLYWNQLTFFDGFFALLLAPEFYLPLRRLGSAYHDRMEAIAAAERLVEIFSAVPPGAVAGTAPFRPAHGEGVEIVLRGVGFRWPGERGRGEEAPGALNGLDLRIAAGERVAVVGPSGAGKSTLFHLLLGFLRPDEGEIRVDGQPLADLDPESWRHRLAWLPQSPRIFHGSVAENIALGRPDAEPEAIEEAARRARCLEFIERLPSGFDTVIGEGGRSLSGGQRQRIALARAFLRDARLVLLDEPTASLDLASEALIRNSLEELAGQATLVVIAHRRQSLHHADRILVLNEGRLVQQGSHRRLLREEGLYRELLAPCATTL